MNFFEFGKENDEIIILLHGGGLSWWNYREVAKNLSLKFRVILPILDGHANSDENFTSIEKNAENIINFIDQNFGGKVLLIGGLSLGGQILLEILAQRKDVCKYALVESALVIPSKLTTALIKPSISCSYWLIKKKWFSKLQFKYLKINPTLFDEYYKDTTKISKSNMIAFLKSNSKYYLKDFLKDCKAKVYVFVGDKEYRQMKKSANLICKKLPNCHLEILKNYYHGEFSLNHPDDYSHTILNILND